MSKRLRWVLWICLWAYVTSSICIGMYQQGYIDGVKQATKIFKDYR